jgi:transposase
VNDFLATIPARLWATIHTFCTDMWDGYLGAIADFLAAHPQITAKIVVDRFHVAQNYREDFDTLRKQEMRHLKQSLPEATYREACHDTLWLLRPNHVTLDHQGRQRLRRLFQHSPALHQAYTLREELTAILNQPLSCQQGRQRLQQWAAKVKGSSVRCFDDFLKTLDNHLEYIANYFHQRANSGFVEGFNNKIRTLTRRCYGIKAVDTLFRRLWLDVKGLVFFA